MAREYNKIAGPFRRDTDLNRVDPSQWNSEAVQLLAGLPVWEYTEKIDGTNIRVIWDGHRVTFAGRTDRAQVHGHLIEKLEALFHAPGVEEWFEEHFPVTFDPEPVYPDVVLHGEGFGAGIQSGGKYSPDKEFVGFDVSVNGRYLARSDSRGIFAALGVPSLPPMNDGPATLFEAIARVGAGIQSDYGDFTAEGVVATTIIPLYDQRGNRLVVKVKTVDLAV